MGSFRFVSVVEKGTVLFLLTYGGLCIRLDEDIGMFRLQFMGFRVEGSGLFRGPVEVSRISA